MHTYPHTKTKQNELKIGLGKLGGGGRGGEGAG